MCNEKKSIDSRANTRPFRRWYFRFPVCWIFNVFLCGWGRCKRLLIVKQKTQLRTTMRDQWQLCYAAIKYKLSRWSFFGGIKCLWQNFEYQIRFFVEERIYLLKGYSTNMRKIFIAKVLSNGNNHTPASWVKINERGNECRQWPNVKVISKLFTGQPHRPSPIDKRVVVYKYLVEPRKRWNMQINSSICVCDCLFPT